MPVSTPDTPTRMCLRRWFPWLLVGIDHFDRHLTHVGVPDDTNAWRIVSRHGFRHASNLEVIAFDAYTVRHGDFHFAHDRGDIDLGRPRQEASAAEIETNRGHDRTDHETGR